jgi:hypothetical protein
MPLMVSEIYKLFVFSTENRNIFSLVGSIYIIVLSLKYRLGIKISCFFLFMEYTSCKSIVQVSDNIIYKFPFKKHLSISFMWKLLLLCSFLQVVINPMLGFLYLEYNAPYHALGTFQMLCMLSIIHYLNSFASFNNNFFKSRSNARGIHLVLIKTFG